MTYDANQKIAANYMGALSTLLCGRPGRLEQFVQRVDAMLCGIPADAIQLMQLGERVRQTGRPLLWVHHSTEQPNVPEIGLVALIDNQTRVFENCMLWVSPSGGAARLVPDSFGWGSYRFDDDLCLRHVATTPAKTFKAAEPGMVRAYRRLRQLEAHQRDRDDAFPLPELLKAA